VRLFEPVVPITTLPNATGEAVTLDNAVQSPTAPVTDTSAKATDEPIKVETPSAMRAMAASLDLLDFANIFDSPYFFLRTG